MASSKIIPKGTKLSSSMVEYRNPGTGIPAKDAHKVLGKIALRDIPEDELLSYEFFQ